MHNPEKAPTSTPEKIGAPRLEKISASESLLYLNQEDTLWPEEIQHDSTLEQQATIRRELLYQFEEIWKKIPQATAKISQAIDHGDLSEPELEELYTKLCTFLNEDPLNSRIELYLPFEILPDDNWRPSSPSLQNVIDTFKKTYVAKWKESLSIYDTRAHFVDGDIPEPEIRTGQLPKVSKAAHLIPILLKKSLISFDEIIQLMTNSNDPILTESIADTLPVLADMQLLTPKDIEKMSMSSSRLLNNMAIIIANNFKTQKNTPLESPIKRDQEWLLSLEKIIDEEVEAFSVDEKLPEARKKWLYSNHIEKIINSFSDEVTDALFTGELAIKDLTSFIDSPKKELLLLAIESIKKYIERKAQEDVTEAKKVVATVQPQLQALWENNQNNIKDTLESMWLRLASLGIVEKANTQHQQEELAKITEATYSIESNTELSPFVYPASVIYGSKAKGYSTRNADTDIAVFIKPNTLIENRSHLQKELSDNFPLENKGTILEFWTATSDSGLEVQDFPNPDAKMADSTLAPVLFGGLWCGNEEAIRELYSKLLTGFLYSKGKIIFGHDARTLWLREMERDALQYRLMHKGYARSHPPQGGIKTEHSDQIDSESMFWDSGYRRLATEIFLKKVFLPQLDK